MSPSHAERTCVAGARRSAAAVAVWSSGWLNVNRSAVVVAEAAPSTLLSTETRTPLDGLTAVP